MSKIHSICKCGDPDCRRVVKSTPEGKLYTENFFSCGDIKRTILKLSKMKLI